MLHKKQIYLVFSQEGVKRQIRIILDGRMGSFTPKAKQSETLINVRCYLHHELTEKYCYLYTLLCPPLS